MRYQILSSDVLTCRRAVTAVFSFKKEIISGGRAKFKEETFWEGIKAKAGSSLKWQTCLKQQSLSLSFKHYLSLLLPFQKNLIFNLLTFLTCVIRLATQHKNGNSLWDQLYSSIFQSLHFF